MIIIYVGGVGSGKTLSIVRQLKQRKRKAFTNFNVKKIPDITRLEVSHIVQKYVSEDKKRESYSVNYTYWNQQLEIGKPFDIYLDEVHNIIHARNAMSNFNKNASIWVAQIRKILGQSKHSNLYLITQKPMRIDIAFRDLAHWWVYVESKEFKHKKVATQTIKGKKLLPLNIIKCYYFNSLETLQAFELNKKARGYKLKTAFIGNNYYRYYDSYELVDFGDKYL